MTGSAAISAIALLAAVGFLVGLALISWMAVRRVMMHRDPATFDCYLRRGAPAPGETGGQPTQPLGASGWPDPRENVVLWRLGLGRYETQRLEWFLTRGLSLRPRRTYRRASLVVETRRRPVGAEAYSLPPGSIVLECSYDGKILWFGMDEPDADAFAAWVESSPPTTHGVL